MQSRAGEVGLGAAVLDHICLSSATAKHQPGKPARQGGSRPSPEQERGVICVDLGAVGGQYRAHARIHRPGTGCKACVVLSAIIPGGTSTSLNVTSGSLKPESLGSWSFVEPRPLMSKGAEVTARTAPLRWGLGLRGRPRRAGPGDARRRSRSFPSGPAGGGAACCAGRACGRRAPPAHALRRAARRRPAAGPPALRLGAASLPGPQTQVERAQDQGRHRCDRSVGRARPLSPFLRHSRIACPSYSFSFSLSLRS